MILGFMRNKAPVPVISRDLPIRRIDLSGTRDMRLYFFAELVCNSFTESLKMPISFGARYPGTIGLISDMHTAPTVDLGHDRHVRKLHIHAWLRHARPHSLCLLVSCLLVSSMKDDTFDEATCLWAIAYSRPKLRALHIAVHPCAIGTGEQQDFRRRSPVSSRPSQTSNATQSFKAPARFNAHQISLGKCSIMVRSNEKGAPAAAFS